MSKFYEKVATPETQFRQSKAPSGPTVDVNARQEIENEFQSSLGKAITDFVGTVGNVAQGLETLKRTSKAKMIAKHGLDAKAETVDYGSTIAADVDSKAREKYKKGIDDLNTEELNELTHYYL